MDWTAWVVLATLAVAIIAQGFDWVQPDFAFLALIAFYATIGIYANGVTGALRGFADPGLWTVMSLYGLAEGITQTGGLDRIMSKILGQTSNVRVAQFRMLVPVTVLSAFLNNTPIVALMIPIVMSWCNRCGISPKKLLIPLSYGATLGGTITLIGTSTNLVVSAELATNLKIPFAIFDLAPIGVPYALWGIAYILLVSPYLLAGSSFEDKSSPVVGLSVPYDGSSTLVNRSISEAGLRKLKGLFLASVRRKGRVFHAVPTTFVLEAGDILYFAGDLSQVDGLKKQFGLSLFIADKSDPLADGTVKDLEIDYESAKGSPRGNTISNDGRLVQVTVKSKAPIIGQNIRDIGFRSRFGASVISAVRGKERLHSKIGDIVVASGDKLLLVTGDSFDGSSIDFSANFNKPQNVDGHIEREYMMPVQVKPGGSVAGKTITEAGLRGVVGLFLVSIDRANGTRINAVGPDEVLQDGDMLWFAGELDCISFVLKNQGLQHGASDQVAKLNADILDRHLVQVSIAQNSPLAGSTASESRFRTKYDAAIIAIHRKGQRLQEDLSHARLQAGDVLLLDTGLSFLDRYSDHHAFSLITEVPNSAPPKTKLMWVAIIIAVGIISVQIIQSFLKAEGIIKCDSKKKGQANWILCANKGDLHHFWAAATMGSMLMMVLRCMSGKQHRRSYDWEVFVAIGAAFGAGDAMELTGLAQGIADIFINASNAIGGPVAALSSMFFATALLTEILSNNAAALIMYKIAWRVAVSLKIDAKLMAIAVMLGGSAGWMSPFGYQCNLMVYSAGGYTTWEFIKIGAPMQPFMWLGATLFMAYPNIWYVWWILTAGLVAFIMFAGAIQDWFFSRPVGIALLDRWNAWRRRNEPEAHLIEVEPK